MIVEPNQKNLGPEISIERVLRLDDREIVARRNNATVEDDEIIFSGSENDSLADTRRKRRSTKPRRNMELILRNKMVFHG